MFQCITGLAAHMLHASSNPAAAWRLLQHISAALLQPDAYPNRQFSGTVSSRVAATSTLGFIAAYHAVIWDSDYLLRGPLAHVWLGGAPQMSLALLEVCSAICLTCCLDTHEVQRSYPVRLVPKCPHITAFHKKSHSSAVILRHHAH